GAAKSKIVPYASKTQAWTSVNRCSVMRSSSAPGSDVRCYTLGRLHAILRPGKRARRRDVMQIKGSLVALITPFRDGKVDEKAFQSFVEWQIEQGTHGLVPCGTTGESPTLSHEEHDRVVQLCIETARGRVPVIAGAGSNNTVEAIELTAFAKEAGADAVLSVTGYYNKP